MSDAVRKISAVTQLINDIACQTNLLALNATIRRRRQGLRRGGATTAEIACDVTQTSQAAQEVASRIVSVSDEASQTEDRASAHGAVDRRLRGTRPGGNVP